MYYIHLSFFPWFLGKTFLVLLSKLLTSAEYIELGDIF